MKMEFELEKEKQHSQLELEKEKQHSQLELEKEKQQSQLELEKEKLELEKEKHQSQLALEKEKQQINLELEKEKLHNKFKIRELELQSRAKAEVRIPTFDVNKNLHLVPPFKEEDVDKFFLHFEKISQSMKWPEDKLTLRLQSVLIGKARDVYSTLSVSQISDYKLVKKSILNAYKLVPEAYHKNLGTSKLLRDKLM